MRERKQVGVDREEKKGHSGELQEGTLHTLGGQIDGYISFGQMSANTV